MTLRVGNQTDHCHANNHTNTHTQGVVTTAMIRVARRDGSDFGRLFCVRSCMGGRALPFPSRAAAEQNKTATALATLSVTKTEPSGERVESRSTEMEQKKKDTPVTTTHATSYIRKNRSLWTGSGVDGGGALPHAPQLTWTKTQKGKVRAYKTNIQSFTISYY